MPIFLTGDTEELSSESNFTREIFVSELPSHHKISELLRCEILNGKIITNSAEILFTTEVDLKVTQARIQQGTGYEKRAGL